MKVLSLVIGTILIFSAEVAFARCGNGVLDDGEECDFVSGSNFAAHTRDPTCWHVDRKYLSGRLECTSSCRYKRDEGELVGCVTASGPRCGDGRYSPGETWCEPALQCNCSDNCVRLDGRCGDGCVDPGEVCDNGTENNDLAPDACRTNCRAAHCGDGVIDTGEQCDDGYRNSDFEPNACRADCKLPRCGDGIVDTANGEQCDEGAANSDALGSTCSTQCIIPGCGNGVLEVGEQCDDGNTSDGDACTSLCRYNVCGDGRIWTGIEACEYTTPWDPGSCRYDCGQNISLCGNGVVDAGERCDDGADRNSTEPNNPCRPDCQPRRCGDGIVDAGEECDLEPGCAPDCTWIKRR